MQNIFHFLKVLIHPCRSGPGQLGMGFVGIFRNSWIAESKLGLLIVRAYWHDFVRKIGWRTVWNDPLCYFYFKETEGEDE